MDLAAAKKRFTDAGKRQGWWSASGVVAALSGGGDSVALLWLLKTFFEGRIVAAHLDHCTREGVSHADAEFCEALCTEWGIDIRIKIVDVDVTRRRGESFEMAGRRERYGHFTETAEKEGLPFIALGHSADDLVETQLMNLFRGTGLAGLRGIPETRGMIVRPVIGFWRAELRDILKDNGVAWREDESNSDTIYQRNLIRGELLPWIRNNFNTNFEKNMVGLSAQISEELCFKNIHTQKNLEKISLNCYSSLACWSASALGSFCDLELIDMIRMQGDILGLPALSRDRTHKLAALLRKGGKWRFQWAYDVEVCYSARGIGWLRRGDVEKTREKADKNQGLSLPWWAR